MTNFHPMPRKPVGRGISNIMKRSRKELQTTRIHMHRDSHGKRDASCNVNDHGSHTTNMYPSKGNNVQRSEIIKMGSPTLSKRSIEVSTPIEFKVAGLVHKENNINGVNNYKASLSLSRVKEGSKAAQGHASDATDDIVNKLDYTNSRKEFISFMFKKNPSNNQKGLKEADSEFGNDVLSYKCDAKKYSEKRQRELSVEGKPKNSVLQGVQLDNEIGRQMKKCRCHKVISKWEDDKSNNGFGDQNLGVNHNVMPMLHAKEQNYCCSKPIDEPSWRGIFKIDDQNYVSLSGHLSTKYGEKVWKLSRSLMPIVEVKKVSRSKAWPKRWNASTPNGDDIGLYFFLHEMRQNEEMDELLKEVIEKDLALRAIFDESEMLIFPSTLLPEQYKRFKSKHYLWGVFKPTKPKAIAVADPSGGIGCCAHEVEKETRHFSINQEKAQYEDQNPTTILLTGTTTLGYQVLYPKNLNKVQATSEQPSQSGVLNHKEMHYIVRCALMK